MPRQAGWFEYGVELHVNAHLQAQRIERYLPVLEAKRDEMARQLEELDELIADEKIALMDLRREADPDGWRREKRQRQEAL
jgi:hypothetical protein